MGGKGPLELVDSLPCNSRDGVKLELAAAGVGGEFFQFFGVGGVDLGSYDDHGLFGERMVADAVAEAGEFVVDDAEVFNGIGAAGGVGDVDEVSEEAGALNVAEKLGSETGAEVRALDKAGDIGDDIGFLLRFLAHSDDAEAGLEGGEGVIGDLGPGGGDTGDQGGFAGVGEADKADIGQEFELEAVAALFAGTTQLVLARSLVGGSGKVLVAAAAAAALGDHDALVGLAEVVNQLAGFEIVESGADGHLQDDGAAVLAGAVGAHAVLTALGFVFGVVAEVDKGVVALSGLHENVAAAAAIAA